MSRFGEVIREILDERGMPQAEFARRTGFGTSYVSQVCRGIVDDPSLSRCQIMADVLGVTLQELYDRSFGSE